MSGKGDKPRSCFTSTYRSNFDKIKWQKEEKQPQKVTKKGHKIYIYK